MPTCGCGCGEQTKGGKFLAGHETRFRKRLDDAVGSPQLLERLVAAGQMYADGKMSLDNLGRLVKLIFRQD